MEFLVLLLVVGLFALWVSNRGLKLRVERLEQLVEAGSASGATPFSEQIPEPEPSPAEPEVPYNIGYTRVPKPSAADAEAAVDDRVTTIDLSDAAVAEAEERESVGALFERLVAGRLLVWLGGVALVVAAIYLIRYSIEVGLVTPELRMIGAAVFGLVLIGLGEYARLGRLLADDPRFAQALVGAGVAVLYATTYGSHILYGLIGAATASALMLAVTGAALALSLRHGAPTAVMGLIGGFLTPLLVGDPDAGAVPLLAYLALLDLAIFLIAWRRGWTWLATAAVALSFAWSTWLISQAPGDALAAGVFIVLLAVAAALVRPGGGRSLALIQPLAIGIVQLALLVGRTDLGLPAWGLFAALSAASLVLAALRREYGLAPPLAVAFALLLLLAKATTGEDPLVPTVALGITVLFGVGGLVLTLWRRWILWTAVACAGFAGPALIVRAARWELLDRPAWGLLFLALAAGPTALAWLDRERASDETPADLALLAAGATAAMLAGAAVWDLVPGMWVAAGWLVVALAVGAAARQLRDLALATVAAIVAAIAVTRSVLTVPELSIAALASLAGDPVLAADLPDALATLQALAVPAALLVALRQLLPTLPLNARRAMPIVAGTFAAASLYVWFKQAFGLTDPLDFVARGLVERTIVNQVLFVAGWLLAAGLLRPPRLEPALVQLAGTALNAVAAGRLIWFDLLLHNPAFSAQWVGPWPVLNLILPAYLLSATWLYLARRRADQASRSGFWLIAFLVALIAGAMLLVRQGFHGAILTGDEMPIAEFYGYSLAALLISIALLVAGIRLPDKALRLAGLALLSGTIIKVFVFDAAQLEGVLRILSFVGLGVSAIGIARLYGPVLRAGQAAR